MIFWKETIAGGKKRGCGDEQVREVKCGAKEVRTDSGGAQGEAKKVQNNFERTRKLEEDGRKKKGGN